MNFFERRKFLKQANTLDLTPFLLLGHETGEDGKVSVLLPRFRNKISSTLFQPRLKNPFIRIRLDEFGSATWLLIDGKRTVQHICENLREQFPGKITPDEETEERVSKFLFLLYQQDYISFRELGEPK